MVSRNLTIDKNKGHDLARKLILGAIEDCGAEISLHELGEHINKVLTVNFPGQIKKIVLFRGQVIIVLKAIKESFIEGDPGIQFVTLGGFAKTGILEWPKKIPLNFTEVLEEEGLTGFYNKFKGSCPEIKNLENIINLIEEHFIEGSLITFVEYLNEKSLNDWTKFIEAYELRRRESVGIVLNLLGFLQLILPSKMKNATNSIPKKVA